MNLIVVVDKNWGIGKGNDLLFRLKEDMRFFKEKTVGKVVVMGSNTLKSFPEGKPLKDRKNIVLFPGGVLRSDCEVVQSLEHLCVELDKYDTNDVFVIGGAMFYKTMLPYCDTAYITKVDESVPYDVSFPNLDNDDSWRLVAEGDKISDNGHTISFTTYKNTAVRSLADDVFNKEI